MYLSPSEQAQFKRNIPAYKAAAAVTGVPWVLLAAIHYRENSLLPSRGEGSCMRFDPPSKGREIARKYSARAGRDLSNLENNTTSALICAGFFLQEKMGNRLSQSSPRALILQAAYYYNGTGYGNIRKSPYVYNDPQRGVTLNIVGTDYANGQRLRINKPDPRPGVNALVTEMVALAGGVEGTGAAPNTPTPTAPPYGDKTVFYPTSKWVETRNSAGFLDANYNSWRVSHNLSAAEHTGVDLNQLGSGDADLGRPVYAVADGKVIASAYFRTWGNIILIHHPQFGSIFSQYAHCRERYVKAGDIIQGGTCIGTIGKGDGSFLAHLHFEIRTKDMRADYWPGTNASFIRQNYLDPIVWLRSHNARDVDDNADDLHPALQRVRDQLYVWVAQNIAGARMQVVRDYAPSVTLRSGVGTQGKLDAASTNPHTVRPALAFDFAIIRNGSRLASSDPAYARAGKQAETLGAQWGPSVTGGVPGESGSSLRNHVQLKNTPAALRDAQDKVERGIIVAGQYSGTVAEQDSAPAAPIQTRGAACPDSTA